jgi:hypothetical protein
MPSPAAVRPSRRHPLSAPLGTTLAAACLALLAGAPLRLAAQARPALAPPAQQVAAATLPLPEAMRAGAAVLGYRAAGKLELLRPGSNGMRCLADDPADDRFHVACYHESMEPFMARGRELRAQGVTGAQVDTVRYAEVMSGRIAMPKAAAALYQLTGPKGDYDASANAAPNSKPLFVIYVPGATTASTGIGTTPAVGQPWLMFPGTPKAHIMFTPSM